MKIRRICIENVRSFLDRQEMQIPGDISIIIGPNGGGKTNLLDTTVLALRLFLLKSWTPRHNPTQDWQDRYDWVNNDVINISLLERNSSGANLRQVIELDIEITRSDIDNIIRTKNEALELIERSKSRYTNSPIASAASWDLENLEAGSVHTFTIINGDLQNTNSTTSEVVRGYLETYEVNSRLRADFDKVPLSTPMISLPVNRSSSGITSSVSLAEFNEFDYKRTVDAASSRTSGSITNLAIGRLARRYRELLERDDGRAKTDFNKDPAIESFTEILRSLGYEWSLQCTNVLRNQYDVQLIKQGSSFRVSAASSGERELLTYLFAIYALNVRDALIVVDEPELHLHPRWQRTLLSLFERLSNQTGNQFLMATHSPVFVSPSSIQYVSRVYSENQRSKIIRLGDSRLPDTKHLFSIVNSQNNERVFFADLVILVEGISDRIFFEALLAHFKIGEGSGKVYEVVSVGGKMIFSQYEKLLTACRVPYVIIADLDYVQQIGSESLKSMFSVSAQSIKQKVVDDPTSIDGKSLLERMDKAISTGDLEDLRSLWEYIKSRQSRLRSNLTEVEVLELKSFIAEQRNLNRFVLSRGSLEEYLPIGFKGKDLEKLIRFTSNTDFWNELPTEGREELQVIIESIKL